jgi:hypothetical protein
LIRISAIPKIGSTFWEKSKQFLTALRMTRLGFCAGDQERIAGQRAPDAQGFR